MCRWMAYKGKSIYIEDWLLNSEHSLIEQSKSADLTQYEVNGDGFGLGWFGDKPEPGLFKSIRPAWNNSNLQSLAAHVRSPLFIAHVRAATGTPIQETNSHPFQYKNWLMVHNGIIHHFATVKKSLIEHINPEYFQYILGSTDSEVLFYLLLSNGLAKDVHLAIETTIKLIESIALQYQLKHAVRMTLGISDGKALWAVRYSSNKSSPSLFYSTAEQEFPQQLLVVSEPLDQCSRCWSLIAENSILHVSSNNKIKLSTIRGL